MKGMRFFVHSVSIINWQWSVKMMEGSKIHIYMVCVFDYILLSWQSNFVGNNVKITLSWFVYKKSHHSFIWEENFSVHSPKCPLSNQIILSMMKNLINQNKKTESWKEIFEYKDFFYLIQCQQLNLKFKWHDILPYQSKTNFVQSPF